MMNDNTSIEAILEAEILPNLPTVAIKLISLNSDAAASDIARIITHDISLTARIIKAANSPVFGSTQPVTNVKRGIAILGNRQVLALSLASSLTPPADNILDFSCFWEVALATAITTRQILQVLDPWKTEEGFTAGLLANLGTILLASAHPDKYRKALELNQKNHTPITEIEKDIFGFCNTELGLAAAIYWNFPPSFQAVTQHYHAPQGFTGDDETKTFIQAVHIGKMITDLFCTAQYEQLKSNFLADTAGIPVLQCLSFDELAKEVSKELQQASAWMGTNQTLKMAIEWVNKNDIDSIQPDNPYQLKPSMAS